MITSFPPHPHPNPILPGERESHSSPQQSWGVFWHILINSVKKLLEQMLIQVKKVMQGKINKGKEHL